MQNPTPDVHLHENTCGKIYNYASRTD